MRQEVSDHVLVGSEKKHFCFLWEFSISYWKLTVHHLILALMLVRNQERRLRQRVRRSQERAHVRGLAEVLAILTSCLAILPVPVSLSCRTRVRYNSRLQMDFWASFFRNWMHTDVEQCEMRLQLRQGEESNNAAQHTRIDTIISFLPMFLLWVVVNDVMLLSHTFYTFHPPPSSRPPRPIGSSSTQRMRWRADERRQSEMSNRIFSKAMTSMAPFEKFRNSKGTNLCLVPGRERIVALLHPFIQLSFSLHEQVVQQPFVCSDHIWIIHTLVTESIYLS